jgi:hypothetical protein
MKLFEHKDFEQAILGAEQHFAARKLRPAIIEKDYYVTEALRIIAAAALNQIIFKGGTSLAKGWNLIQRFSEDIDIFLDPLAFKPVLGKNTSDRELKRLLDAVAAHPALTFVAAESQTIGGFRKGLEPDVPICQAAKCSNASECTSAFRTVPGYSSAYFTSFCLSTGLKSISSR